MIVGGDRPPGAPAAAEDETVRDEPWWGSSPVFRVDPLAWLRRAEESGGPVEIGTRRVFKLDRPAAGDADELGAS